MAFLQNLKKNSLGLTLIELLIAISVIGILAGIAIPSYISHRRHAKITAAISEMKTIEYGIKNYYNTNNKYPDSLSEIDTVDFIDPWGNPYRYLRLDGGTTTGLKGKRRRDKNANPVNSDFDLYSMGEDGETTAQFTAKNARDDVVRANDGSYYGLAKNH
jgi:general secretion pathway protein G